jgi:two-component system chemotaxis sensor kinase CheA
MDMSRYLDLFLAEAREHLEASDRLLEDYRGGPPSPDTIHRIFRHVHSMKGMAATMGFDRMVAITHAVEDLLDLHRTGDSAASLADRCTVLWEALACLGRMIEAVGRGGGAEDGQVDAIVRRLRSELPAPGAEPHDSSRADGSAPAAVAAPQNVSEGAVGKNGLEPRVRHRYRIELSLPEDSWHFAGQAVGIVRRLGELGEIRHATPPLPSAARTDARSRLGVTVTTERSHREVEDEIRAIQGLDGFEIHPLPPEEPTAAGPSDSDDGGPLVRVRADLLDRTMELALELALSQEHLATSLPSGAETGLSRRMNRCRVLMKELYGDLMELRLVPFESVVHRLMLGVRDLAARLGKQVRFEVDGRDVRLDRGILETLVDPLLHVVRNALDHGIEDLETRVDRGKSGPGRVRLRLSRVNDRVRIVIEDDGAGLDPVKLRGEAIARGFLQVHEAARLDDRDALLLTTLPGFSTASAGGPVSGRGVGMDVVRDAVERLGGRLGIDSTHGVGTSVILDLPQTLAVIQAILVRSSGELYALPVHAIQRTIDLSSAPLENRGRTSLVEDGGRRLRLLRLEEGFGCPWEASEELGPTAAALVTTGAEGHAVVVDELVGRREILVRPLEPPLRALASFTGASLLENGAVALVVDPEALAGTTGASRRAAGSGPAGPRRSSDPPHARP